MHTIAFIVISVLLALDTLDARAAYKRHSVVSVSDTQCTDGRVKCPTSDKCIQPNWLCDGDNDCGDNSDESDTCRTRICPDGQVKCASGQCLDKERYCAGLIRCNDGNRLTDVICPHISCEDGNKKCPYLSKCIKSDFFCDGDNDCGDMSDESDDCNTRVCPDGMLSCGKGQCLDKEQYCAGSVRCRDGTRFTDVVCPHISCEDGYTKCPHLSKCIKSIYFCDGDNDCGDMSDEPDNCNSRTCEPNEVRCNSGQCLNKEEFCRGIYTCRDSSVDINRDICQSVNIEPEIINPFADETERTCFTGLMSMRQICGDHPSIPDIPPSIIPDDAYQKLIEMELNDICRPLMTWLECMSNIVLDSCANVANPMISSARQGIAVGTAALNYICVQEIDVINRHKACLLQKSHNTPMPAIAESVTVSCSGLIAPAHSDPYILCNNQEIQACIKHAVAAQCGDEIATTFDGLANRLRDAFGCPSTHVRSISALHHKRRGAMRYMDLYNSFKYFF